MLPHSNRNSRQRLGHELIDLRLSGSMAVAVPRRGDHYLHGRHLLAPNQHVVVRCALSIGVLCAVLAELPVLFGVPAHRRSRLDLYGQERNHSSVGHPNCAKPRLISCELFLCLRRDRHRGMTAAESICVSGCSAGCRVASEGEAGRHFVRVIP